MQRPTNRLENLQTLRMANADAAAATAFGTLVSGTFLIGLIKYLNGSDLWIGLFAALPSLLGLLQIPGGIIGRRFKTFKRFVLPGGVAWRLLYAIFIPLPLLAIAADAKLFILATVVALASAAVLFVTPIANEWIAELVPPSSRGFFFSRRNAIATAVGSVVGLGGAFILDRFRLADEEPLGFTVIFALGILCALISLFFFLRMHDSPRPNPQDLSLKEGIKSLANPFVDRNFRRVIIFLGLFVIGQVFAGPLFAAFAIESLELPFTIIQWTGVMHAFGNVLTASFWGFLADKYGNKPILMITGFLLTLTPVMWLFCQPNRDLYNALILLPSHILVGATWAGVGLCQYNLVLATAKPEDRSNYLSVVLTVQAIIGFVSPILGANLLTLCRGGMDAEMAYKWVFGVTMAIRFFSVFFLAPVREEGALKVRQALRDLRKVSPRGFRAMRQLTQSADVQSRASAIQSVATEGFALASDEIVKALSDPSPQVRRQAALALAKLNDPAAARALITQILEHPDLVEEETVEALGQIGGPDAVQPLVGLLQSPRSIVRRAAAKALGRLGSAEAIPPLIEAAEDKGDPDLRRSSLQALRALCAEDAAPVVSDALFDPMPSVRIAAAEAVSELELKEALPYVRQSLSYYQDEAASEVAYALGSVGSLEDIPLILQEASECLSPTTRRRCLLGVARLLDVESDFYKLLLLDGMPRDSALYEKLRPLLKGNKRLRDALALYSSGQEEEALQQLVPSKLRPEIAPFAECPVEELFLVAACAIAAAKPRA